MDEATRNGTEIADTATIHTLPMLERICARDERVENVTDGAGCGSGTRADDTAGNKGK